MRRAKTVRLQAYNLKGEVFELTASDLPARVIQHEFDHLQGALFIDKFGTLGKLASRSSLKVLERDFKRAQQRGEIPSDVELEKLFKEPAAAVVL